MQKAARNINRPSFFWLLMEPGRALTELGVSYSANKLSKAVPTGDGHPVMVLPGLMCSKPSTAVMRTYLNKLGYDAFDWGMGRNMGKVEYMELLLERLDEIHLQTGQQISLIGWSLGGVFARQLAKERPDMIRQVITLGSPFRNITQPNNVEWLYTIFSGGKQAKDTNQVLLENIPLPAPVPSTAIYSKEDGIVPWQECLEKDEDALHQNIQVRSSHIGLGLNPSVLSILADRLQYNRDNWQLFKPKNLVDNLLFYPSL